MPNSRRRAALPAPIYDIVRSVRKAHPMDVLRTAVSALAAFDPRGRRQFARRRPLRKGIRLTSQVPMIVAAHEHIRNGREPVRAAIRSCRMPPTSCTCCRAASRRRKRRG